MSQPQINQKESVTRYRDENVFRLLQYANNKRFDGFFNDVTIQADTESIPANRMVLSCYCEFFEKMFLTEFKDKYHDHVEIHQFDGNAVKSIIQYIYTGCIDIDGDNVMNLLATADFLQMDDVKRFCFEYFESVLTIDNCIDIIQASSLYRNPSPMKKTYQLISNNFDEIAQTENFKIVSKDVFISLLAKLNSDKVEESSIYTAIMNWVGQDENRKADFTILFLSLDLHRLSVKFLNDVVRKEPLVETNNDCLKAVIDCILKNLQELQKQRTKPTDDAAVREDGNDDAERKLLCIGGKWKKSVLEIYNTVGKPEQKYPDLPNELSNHCALKHRNAVYCIGGVPHNVQKESTKVVYRMDLKAGGLKWEKAASMIEERCSFGAAIFGDNLVVAGGNDGKYTMNTAELYEVKVNQWRNIATMQQCRMGFALVEADGKLFAIGGRPSDGGQDSSSVEMLDDVNGNWSFVQAMNNARSFFAAVCCSGFIYAIGCSPRQSAQTVEKYDPSSNQWTFVKNANVWRLQPAACVLDEKVFVFGGWGNSGKTIEYYDPTLDQWTIVGETEDGILDHAIVAL